MSGTTHAVSGLTCGAGYAFRVSAYGDGTAHKAAWGEASTELAHSTAACNVVPAFGSSTYAFSIAEDAAVNDDVGSVSATDADSDALAYSITVGNGGGKFAIGGSSGAITVAAALDYETTTSYSLTVQADDGNGGMATVAVTVTVTQVEAASSDATLSALSLSGIDFGTFSSGTTSYTASVANDVAQSTVTATANDGEATYVVKLNGATDADGTVDLSVGENAITVEVTAEDGVTKQTYTVAVTRAEAPTSCPPDGCL